MRNKYIFLILFFSSSLSNLHAFDFFGDSWKDDTVLQDGKHLIVSRHQTYGGGHEIGQHAPIQTQKLKFDDLISGATIEWTDSAPQGVPHADLTPIAVHYFSGIPYVVAVPHLCDAYEYWHRPNPPYIIYRFEKNEWKIIDILDFPLELVKANLLVDGMPRSDMKVDGVVPSSVINQFNEETPYIYLKKITRIKTNVGC